MAWRPGAGAQVRPGTIVSLVAGGGFIPSPVVLLHHPAKLVVPRLVGLTYRAAQSCTSRTAAYWLRFDSAAPLSARDAARAGLDAYVIATQDPPPGAIVDWGGARVPGGGYRPTVVSVTLAPRGH